MKKILVVILALCMMFVFSAPAMAKGNGADWYVSDIDRSNDWYYNVWRKSLIPVMESANDKLIEITKAEEWNQCTLVPFRFLFERYGATVEWDNTEKTVTAVRSDGAIIKLEWQSDKATITKDGVTKEYTMNVEVIAKGGGALLVPLRFVAENLGCIVQWDNIKKAVIINR